MDDSDEKDMKLFNEKALWEIREEAEDWEKKNLDEEDRKAEETESGIPVDLVQTPNHIENMDYLKSLNFPGEEPFTRGIHPNMYKGKVYTYRQLTGFAGPEETNERMKYMLERGSTGLNIVFDLPTIRGYDSTDELARRNVGECGVSIDSLKDMEKLFEGIPIGDVTVSLVTHLPSNSAILFSMYLAMAEKRGIDWNELAGSLQNDFIMETVVGSAPEVINPKDAFKIQCDVNEFLRKNVSRWNTNTFNGYNLREAGTDAALEVAVAFANAIETMEELEDRGLEIDDIARRIAFFWDLCDDFFEEIAKIRAGRRLWAKIIDQRFDPEKPQSKWMRCHVQTAGRELTRVEPLNNIARAAIHALAAVLAGVQSLHVDSYDEAYSIPTEKAARISLRTQQIISQETEVTRVVDPLGGSYYMESLTDEMEEKIRKNLNEIRSLGGLVKAVEDGWLHRKIIDHATEHFDKLESGEKKKVGYNCYVDEAKESESIDVYRYPEGIEEKKKEELSKLKNERDSSEHEKSIDELREACKEGRNIIPATIEAVKSYATEGEIHKIYREEFGLWEAPI